MSNGKFGIKGQMPKLPDNTAKMPEVFTALQNEIFKNEKLMIYMMENVTDDMDFGDRLGVVCAWMNLELDGVYDPIALADLITQELRKRNTIILTSVSAAVNNILN